MIMLPAGVPKALPIFSVMHVQAVKGLTVLPDQLFVSIWTLVVTMDSDALACVVFVLPYLAASSHLHLGRCCQPHSLAQTR